MGSLAFCDDLGHFFNSHLQITVMNVLIFAYPKRVSIVCCDGEAPKQVVNSIDR